jgi:quercetin dioxygenase-like cupin family protein
MPYKPYRNGVSVPMRIPTSRSPYSALLVLLVGLGTIPLSLASSEGAENMRIDRNGTLPSSAGPSEYFTGSVRIDMQFQREVPSRVSGATVRFEPGARTAWHSHPLGQTLIVISGKGWTQCEGGPIIEINPGDHIWCPPGHRHWHGATPTTAMPHVAIHEALDGKVVTWMERVSDEEYRIRPPMSD